MKLNTIFIVSASMALTAAVVVVPKDASPVKPGTEARMRAILHTGDNSYNDHYQYNYKCGGNEIGECNQISGACKTVKTCAGTCIHRDSPAGAYCSRTKAVKARAETEPVVPAFSCRQDCTIPWGACMGRCQYHDKNYCTTKCNCELFRDPNTQCRKEAGE
jgi:hypothetical protein